MESIEKVLTVGPCDWSEPAARLIAMAVQHAAPLEIRNQVQSGVASLFGVQVGGELAAVFVLRVDRDSLGSEGVIVAAAGRVPGVDLTAVVLPHVEAMFRDCRAVRIHTARPGMARKLVRAGYRPSEIVFAKDLK